MQWLNDLLTRWRLASASRRENYLKALANRTPSFQWILVQVGTSGQSRSPMLADNEIREWFRENFPVSRVVEIDERNKIVFYE